MEFKETSREQIIASQLSVSDYHEILKLHSTLSFTCLEQSKEVQKMKDELGKVIEAYQQLKKNLGASPLF